ncbi:MAG: hypothetical protein GX316_01345 [Firmicutes bacterium]|nr:hypothetical protein [Bacillota bacterium]
MYRVCSLLKCFILAAAIVSLFSAPSYAGFGYQDVYQYDQKTETWVLLEPVDSTNIEAYMVVEHKEVTGNHAPLSVSGSVNILAQSKTLRAASVAGESLEKTNGPFSITAVPLTDNITVDNPNERFVLPGAGSYAEWRFIYTVTNLDNTRQMEIVVLKDNFGAELDVLEDSSGQWRITQTHGKAVISLSGNAKKVKFEWGSFLLDPGETASLTMDLKLGKNPAGHQHYTTCDKINDLSSGGVLKFRWKGQGNSGQTSHECPPFKVWVPCDAPSSFSVSFSSRGLEWYIKKPGQYYAKMLDAEVRSTGNATVAVTFSEFGNLMSLDNDQALNVFYAIKDTEPVNSDWITPQYLNEDTSLELNISAESMAGFTMWQKVDLGLQRPGMYTDRGVMTFTLVNSRPTYVGNEEQ